MSAPAAFDELAARYDELWTNTPVGRAQRNQVWRAIDPLFRPGDRVLDIGCGTGEDAAHLAARGVAVEGTDASPAMIAMARQRSFTATVLRAEQIADLKVVYDGALSNFGVLNCVEDLPAFASDLAPRVRPGGALAVCTMGRFCAWETLYYAARLQFGKASRRISGTVYETPKFGTVRYPTVQELRSAFADFELQRWSGIGLFVPPSYVSLPARLVALLNALDRLFARLPLLRALADHRLLIFVRK
jgi:ubiquinone/menaquinone biosynthesis C-methylase UbiE